MTTEDAKSYLSNREIPRLFESLMTGLMYHRPKDHVQYLIDCLLKVQDKGTDNVSWSSFVDIRRSKTPLPPINSEKRPNSSSRRRVRTPQNEKPQSLDESRGSPLPSIQSSTQKQERSRIKPPDVPVVIVTGGPGSGKQTQVERLLSRYPGWVHLSMGDLLRSKIAQKGTAEEKWEMISELVSKGEMAPEDVTLDLFVESLQSHPKATGFIVEGFPRTLAQAEEYDKVVERVDLVFVLDCEEYYSTQRLLRRGAETGKVDDNITAISRRLNAYKDNTLPVIKHYDDKDKAVILDGDRDRDEIAFDLAVLFDTKFFGKKAKDVVASAPPKSPMPPKQEKQEKQEKHEKGLDKKLELEDQPAIPAHMRGANVTVKDEGRKPDLPQAPIVFVAGGPGSGKGTQCEKIAARYDGFVHLSVGDLLRTQISTKGTADDKWGMIGQLVSKGEMAPEEVTVSLLIEHMKKHADAKGYIVEGYPRDQGQVEEFNKNIGGSNFVLLLDCEEYYMQQRLVDRGHKSGRIDDNLNAIGNRLNFFKNNTLPILKYYDDQEKLVIINGDRDTDEIFFDICSLLDFAFFGKKPEAGAAPGEEVIEASVVQEGASTTGDDIANPSHSAILDEAAAEGTTT